MRDNRKGILMTAALAGFLLTASAATIGQARPLDVLPSSNDGPETSAVDTSAPVQTPAAAPAASASTASEDWHTDIMGYLWFPGVHGNVNALDQNVGYKASPSDVLSHVDFGLMGAVAARYKRVVMTADFLWITLSDTKTRVFALPNAPQLSAELKTRPVIFTPKIGYRLIDHPRIKIDGLTGFRFWHLGTTLSLTPNLLGTNPYVSNNWVDPLVGGRIEIPLSPKLTATIAGDVGGWGVGSQMDYQIIPMLTYRIKPKLALDAAWRYLYINYKKTNFTNELAQSGLALGVTYSIN